MKEINHIVVPVDFSEESAKGIKAACSFATKFKSKIHFLHVIDKHATDVDLHPKDAVLGNSNTQHHQQLESEIKKALEKLGKLQGETLPTKHHGHLFTAIGTFETALAEFEKKVSVDLIISGSSSSRNLLEFFTGNATESLIRDNEIPVIAVSENEAVDLNNILIATDLSGIVPNRIFTVCKFLQSQGAKLHFVNIITTELIKKEEVKKKIEELAKSHYIENYQMHIIEHTNEIEGVLKIAEEIKADLVLLKTYEKSRFWTFIKGSLAEQLVRTSDIPVMVENLSKPRW